MNLHWKVKRAAKRSLSEMAAELERNSTASFIQQANKGKKVSLKELVLLRKIYPGSLEMFWKLIEREAR